jgi:hypothetical protein
MNDEPGAEPNAGDNFLSAQLTALPGIEEFMSRVRWLRLWARDHRYPAALIVNGVSWNFQAAAEDYVAPENAAALAHEFEKGLEAARRGRQEIEISPEDVFTPATWLDDQAAGGRRRPFARIEWFADRGDPAVGIQSVAFWALALDQRATVLGELIEAENKRARKATRPGIIRRENWFQIGALASIGALLTLAAIVIARRYFFGG